MGIPSWAVPGAKCVRVEWVDRPSDWPLFVNDRSIRWVPEFGRTYTVSETFVREPYGGFVCLAECPNGSAVGFPAVCFRPLVTQYTEAHDVAKLKHLLTSKEPADA